MGLKCGIVGPPNVGKSTLFNALTSAAISAENYPFCTIEPNLGLVPVPDLRIQQIVDIVSPQQIIYAKVEFIDIAGLVQGAAKGEGLGNKFLSHVRETHAIVQVVRCFEDENITHVAGKVDPISDIEVINIELCLADQATLQKGLEKIHKHTRADDKDIIRHAKLMERLLQTLDTGTPIRNLSLDKQQMLDIHEFQLLTAKPMLYIANLGEADLMSNNFQKLHHHADLEHTEVLPICAEIEAEIMRLDAAERQEFLATLNVDEPGLNRLIRKVYDLLSLQTFITAGKKEVRAWTIKKGASAIEAAASIHTDFARGFIAAEVIHFSDYLKHNGEQGAKEAGKWRLEGRDYILQDGDIMLFRFNV